MQSDIHHSDNNDAEEATESSQLATSLLAPNRLARRSFLRRLGLGAALLAPGAALLSGSGKALAANGSQNLTPGDVAILQLLAAAELIEADLWKQYNELGGVNAPDSGYKEGLVILDGDQPQYIADNTDDEISHAAFLNAYLKSKGEQQVDLKQFARLAPSQVSFVPQTGRLTNLKQLTAGGHATAAPPTRISAQPSRTQSPVWTLGCIPQFRETIPNWATRTTQATMSRRSPLRRDFTSVILNKVARASTRRWLRR